jgi:hypothetical protein
MLRLGGETKGRGDAEVEADLNMAMLFYPEDLDDFEHRLRPFEH